MRQRNNQHVKHSIRSTVSPTVRQDDDSRLQESFRFSPRHSPPPVLPDWQTRHWCCAEPRDTAAETDRFSAAAAAVDLIL